MAESLSADVIDSRLAEVPGWSHVDGHLHRTYTFGDFVEAWGFMARVALVAENGDADRLLRLAGREGDRAGGGLVIAAVGRGAVGGGVLNRHQFGCRLAQRDGEAQTRRARVTFGNRRVPDLQIE